MKTEIPLTQGETKQMRNKAVQSLRNLKRCNSTWSKYNAQCDKAARVAWKPELDVLQSKLSDTTVTLFNKVTEA